MGSAAGLLRRPNDAAAELLPAPLPLEAPLDLTGASELHSGSERACTEIDSG